jgi:spore coat protein A, manganese oxidase
MTRPDIRRRRYSGVAGVWVTCLGLAWGVLGCADDGDQPAVAPVDSGPSADAALLDLVVTESATESGIGDSRESDSAQEVDALVSDAGDASADHDGDLDDSDSGPGAGLIDPKTIPKYVEALVVPPAMPFESRTSALTEYRIAVRQFQQRVLPKGFPMTTVWGYGRASDPTPGPGPESSFNFPAYTIETRRNERVRVTWINELVDDSGHYLPHLFAVDQTVHWADPGNSHHHVDPTPYVGPIPIVTHVHGAHVSDHSDGNPDAWFLPAASNIPDGWTHRGSAYASVTPTDEGKAVFEYTNDQRATSLWYHDHALGITRLNVYAGMAGFFMVRDAEEDSLGLPGPAPHVGDPSGTRYYEIPLAIQDRSFAKNGSFWYPDSRAEFDGYAGPYAPTTSVAPIWNPEFFGNVMLVNGRTWPVLEVEPRLYRFRVLNGCNSRFLVLRMDRLRMPFVVIGNEGGLRPNAPLLRDTLVMAPAERFDVLVDFSSLATGTEIVLQNLAPDEPFKGLSVEVPQDPADPETTGQVMKFKVVGATGQGTSGAVPSTLPAVAPLGVPAATRELTLNENMYHPVNIPVSAELGTGSKGPLGWDDPITETPKVGDTEHWNIINLTGDAHPIHLHLVLFQVLDRTDFDADSYAKAQAEFLAGNGDQPKLNDVLVGEPNAPELWERGWKDTVIANPGQVTRIAARFDLAGLYVWHCHILEHEDNEMMRPYRVLPDP